MFDDETQAWDYSPVIPVIYHKYEKDRKPILYTSKNYSYEIFSPVELEVLVDVMREKGKYTYYVLSSVTQNENQWMEAFKFNNKSISNDSLKEYFTEHLIERIQISSKKKRLKRVPKEYYDPWEDEFWQECFDSQIVYDSV